MAEATLKQWGNSTGILIPKVVLTNLGWKMGDELNLREENGKLELQKKRKLRTSRNKINIEKAFACWDGKYELPSDLSGEGNEVSWGKPVGNEM